MSTITAASNLYANSASSTSSSKSSTSSATAAKNQFLTLLCDQLKNQDPTQPYDNQQFSSQLAQFSQLEQMITMNDTLSSQLNATNSLSSNLTNTALPGMLGKSAKIESSSTTYDGSSSVGIDYSLSSAASTGTLKILDSGGNVVKTVDLSYSGLQAGSNNYTWDGTDSNGSTCAAGTYKIQVDATDASGTAVTPTIYTSGKITAVNFNSSGTTIVVNGVEVSIDKLAAISTEG